MQNLNSEATLKIRNLEQQAQVIKALSHPTHIAILQILRNGEHCVCHTETHLGLRQAYISQQLAVLREAGILQDRRSGWNVFYRVTDQKVFDILDLAQQFTDTVRVKISKNDVFCSRPHCAAKQVSVILNQPNQKNETETYIP